jgi:phosphoglycolate phosphatase-like HAD superfamily hydrolase
VTRVNKLDSWQDGASKRAIEDFVKRVTTPGSAEFVEPPDRVAVYDNDGTLWSEKPLPVELGFILQRLTSMAAKDASLRELQPWKAAFSKDYAWLSDVVTKHYRGDDNDVKVLIGGMLKAFEGMSVETYQTDAAAFMQHAKNPHLERRLQDCSYAPMIELLRFLEENEFTNYIASGGDRDFMRVVSEEIYGVPSERVIGSSNALCYTEDSECGSIVYLAKPDVFDDGPAKPVRIWSRIGRRPILAVGNSNGDIEMLQFAGGPSCPALRLLLLHDDKEREFDYVAGAEKALELAKSKGWTVVSMKIDWKEVFAAVAPSVAA